MGIYFIICAYNNINTCIISQLFSCREMSISMFLLVFYIILDFFQHYYSCHYYFTEEVSITLWCYIIIILTVTMAIICFNKKYHIS